MQCPTCQYAEMELVATYSEWCPQCGTFMIDVYNPHVLMVPKLTEAVNIIGETGRTVEFDGEPSHGCASAAVGRFRSYGGNCIQAIVELPWLLNAEREERR